MNTTKIAMIGLGYVGLPLARPELVEGQNFDAIVLAVAHEQFLKMDIEELNGL